MPFLSYSTVTVVLYIGIVKAWRLWPKILLQNQLNISTLTVGQYWLGIAKPKNVFRSIPSNGYEILKILYLTDIFTDGLTY